MSNTCHFCMHLLQDEGYSLEQIYASSLFKDGEQVGHAPQCPCQGEFDLPVGRAGASPMNSKDFDGWTIKIGNWEVDFMLNRDPQYRAWGYFAVPYNMIIYRAFRFYWLTISWHNPERFE
jgi:hypothetical protein